MRTWALAVFVLAAPAFADDEAVLGGQGESCRARLDCQGGLRCVNHVCTAPETPKAEAQPCQSTANCGELRCVEGRCINPFAPLHPSPDRVRFFLGLVTMGGVAYGGVISNGGRWDTSAQSTFIAAVRAGVLIDERHEIAVELSPFTYAYYQPSPGPTFQVNATYGYRVPLSSRPRPRFTGRFASAQVSSPATPARTSTPSFEPTSSACRFASAISWSTSTPRRFGTR